jgi:hypothetical protein
MVFSFAQDTQKRNLRLLDTEPWGSSSGVTNATCRPGFPAHLSVMVRRLVVFVIGISRPFYDGVVDQSDRRTGRWP